MRISIILITICGTLIGENGNFLRFTRNLSTKLMNKFFFTAAKGNCYVDCKHCDFTGPLYECGYENGVSFEPNKVNSVQEACAKSFAIHILKFEIFQMT